MTTMEHVIDLQATDLAIDQAERQLVQLPERAASAEAHERLAATRKRLAEMETELASAEAAVLAVETESSSIDAKSTRLQAQLRTVIAVREAEALQHEISLLAERRSGLDDQGLVDLERIDVIAVSQAEEQARLPDLEAVAVQAAAALEAASALVQAEIDELRAHRVEQAALVEPDMLARYERMRKMHGGVAVARLNGSRCEGCHLDLSRAEVEALRAVPADELAECPSCGRIVVI